MTSPNVPKPGQLSATDLAQMRRLQAEVKERLNKMHEIIFNALEVALPTGDNAGFSVEIGTPKAKRLAAEVKIAPPNPGDNAYLPVLMCHLFGYPCVVYVDPPGICYPG